MSKLKTQTTTKKKFYQAVGRRKESTASARLHDKRGLMLVNDVPIEEYFPSKAEEVEYLAPFRAVGMLNKFSGTVKVSGGGKSGQLGAVRHAFARALLEYDESLKPTLRKWGLVTRDPRAKERKKYFLRKARKRPQYSKR